MYAVPDSALDPDGGAGVVWLVSSRGVGARLDDREFWTEGLSPEG